MLLTVVLSLVMMASLFLMLYAAVALVQDKRLFTSAPKDIQSTVQPKAERFPGAHVLGMSECPIADDSVQPVPNGFCHGFQFRNKCFFREFAPSVKRDIGLIGILNDTVDGSQSFLEYIGISQLQEISPQIP